MADEDGSWENLRDSYRPAPAETLPIPIINIPDPTTVLLRTFRHNPLEGPRAVEIVLATFPDTLSQVCLASKANKGD